MAHYTFMDYVNVSIFCMHMIRISQNLSINLFLLFFSERQSVFKEPISVIFKLFLMRVHVVKVHLYTQPGKDLFAVVIHLDSHMFVS